MSMASLAVLVAPYRQKNVPSQIYLYTVKRFSLTSCAARVYRKFLNIYLRSMLHFDCQNHRSFLIAKFSSLTVWHGYSFGIRFLDKKKHRIFAVDTGNKNCQ